MRKIVVLCTFVVLLASCGNGKEDAGSLVQRNFMLSQDPYSMTYLGMGSAIPMDIPWKAGDKLLAVSGIKSATEVTVSGGHAAARVDVSANSISFVRGKASFSGGVVVVNPAYDGSASDAALAVGRGKPDGGSVLLNPIGAVLRFSVGNQSISKVSFFIGDAVFPGKITLDPARQNIDITSRKQSATVPISRTGEFFIPVIPGFTAVNLTLELRDASGTVLGTKSGIVEWECNVGSMLNLGDVETCELGTSDIPLPEPGVPQAEGALLAVEGMGVGMNLTGLEHCWESLMNKPQRDNPAYYEQAGGYGLITAKTMQTIADAGYKCVRVPVTWHLHMDSITGTIDKVWLDRVEEVVDLAIDAGLYVIINVHHDAGTILGVWCISDMEHYETTSAGLVNIWTQIANRFKNHDYKLLFEGYNEMLDGDNTWTYPKKQSSMDVCNQLGQDFVNAVRRTGGKNSTRNLIVSTYATTATTRAVEAFRMPKDVVAGHIFVQVHSYVPSEFTSQVATGRNNLVEGDLAAMEGVFEPLDRVLLSKGYPVVLGEFGAYPREGRSEDDRATHAGYMTKLCLQHKVVPIIWYNPLNNAQRSEGVWKYPNIRDAMIDAYNDYLSGK
ncbi:MAG: glycoside hydrolase family 5 protein [Bacteroidales bacterium]|nr:glycoside hydrolase family 5 protein [Bacteroidales bacterium]